GKTISYYLITSLVAISLGLGVGYIFSPGTGVDVNVTGEEVDVNEWEGVVQTKLNIVHENQLESLENADILQIIFFAIFLGVGITMVSEKAEAVRRLSDVLAEIMYKISVIVMAIVRIGIFGLLAPIVG